VNADLLLHVIDIADPLQHEKIGVVEKVLKDLEIENKPCIYVFNKIDAKPDFDLKSYQDLYRQYNPQFISVVQNTGIESLQKAISDHFSR
jgi:GTP-binding protein HflX